MPETEGFNDKPVNRSMRKFRESRESEEEKEYRSTVKKNLPYFTGEDQGWDEFGDRAKKREEKRPALTMNRIRGIMRLITGARPKTETSFMPNEDGDKETADILNSCDDHIDRVNMWKFMEEDWFKFGSLLGRRVVEVKPDYSSNVQGEVKLQLHDGNKFYFESTSKDKDRSDSDDMFMVEYLSKNQAKRLFPKWKGKLDELVANQDGSVDAAQDRDSGAPDEYTDPRANYYDNATKKLCIVYHWYKERYTTTKILNLMTGEVQDGKQSAQDTQDEFEKDDMTQMFKAVPVDFVDVKYRIFCHDIELETGSTPWNRDDGVPTKLSNNFPFVIFEPERIVAGNQTKLTNLIDDLKDPQKYYNVLTSPPFWLLVLTGFTCCTSHSLPTAHVVAFATDQGVDKLKAAMLLGVMGATGVMGRLFWGALSDRIGARRTLLACIFLQTTMLFWLSAADSFHSFVVLLLYTQIRIFGGTASKKLPAVKMITCS